MNETVGYWHVPVKQGISNLVMVFQVESKRTVKNPNFDFGLSYHSGAYLNRLQLSETTGAVKAGPLLARQEGGRSMTLLEDDSTVKIENVEFGTNVKGAGVLTLIPKRGIAQASRYIRSETSARHSYPYCRRAAIF